MVRFGFAILDRNCVFHIIIQEVGAERNVSI